MHTRDVSARSIDGTLSHGTLSAAWMEAQLVTSLPDGTLIFGAACTICQSSVSVVRNQHVFCKKCNQAQPAHLAPLRPATVHAMRAVNDALLTAVDVFDEINENRRALSKLAGQ